MNLEKSCPVKKAVLALLLSELDTVDMKITFFFLEPIYR